MSEPVPANPDNSRLLILLDAYHKADGSAQAYREVVLELLDGDSFLMFPIVDPVEVEEDGMFKPTADTTLKISSASDAGGVRSIAVFTDERSLLEWTKGPVEHTSMRSQDILQFARENDFDRMVINAGGPNVFVLALHGGGARQHSLPIGTRIALETPKHPLSTPIMKSLIGLFRRFDRINEVYCYGQTKDDAYSDNAYSTVLGFRLGVSPAAGRDRSEAEKNDNKKAIIHAVQQVIQGEPAHQPFDVFFIESEQWYENIRSIDGALVYKRGAD